MSSIKPNTNDSLREQLEKYTKNWRWFLVSLGLFFIIGLLYLRYATDIYNVKASIKIANTNNRQNNPLSEANQMNDYGLFSRQTNSVDDEIEVIKSRELINNVVKDLNLNVQYFIKGNIRSLELFKNPPVTVNFFSNDSIIKNIDTTLTLHVDSKTEFTFENTSEKLNFGDKISTGFGDIVITPHFDTEEMQVDKDVTIKISPIEKVAAYYNKKIKISAAGEESSIVDFSLDDPEPDKGVAIINKLIDEYNQHVIDAKKEVVRITSEFINNRLQVVSAELSEVDLTAEYVKQNNRLTDLSSQSSIFLQSERDIQARQVATSTQLQLVDYMENYLDSHSSNGDLIPANMSFEDNSISEITQRHNDLVIQRNKILKNSSEINPVVVNLDEQISNLKQNLRASLRNIRSSNEIRLQSLNQEGSKISSKIYSAPKKERQFRDLKRQQDIKESLYLYLLEKREESAITHGVTSPNAIIVDNAFASVLPVWPKKAVIFVGVIILGFIFPILFFYIKSIFDTKIRTKSDVTKNFTVPFLGDIPKSTSKETLVKKVDYSPKAEAFRLLRTNIDFMLSNIPSEEGKVIFVTSTTSQEGKSHTSVNLSKSLSFSGKKVLLLETDIRVPKANKYMAVKNKTGLTDYLIINKMKLSEAIESVDDNLDMLPSGTIPPNPAELLMSNKMDTLFKNAKKEYDYIIVDTAAVGLVTDTLIISKYADMVIYVVRANYLSKQDLSIAETMHQEKRLPNMAILLNGVTSKKGYGYGYGKNPSDGKSKFKFI